MDAVFNYDVPDELENYTHRIGRTGRAKRHGVAYTFIATISEGLRMDDIIRNTRSEVQRLKYDKDSSDAGGALTRHPAILFFFNLPGRIF